MASPSGNFVSSFLRGTVSASQYRLVEEFIEIARTDATAELECKVLSGEIRTKNIADRLIQDLRQRALKVVDEEPYLNVLFPDNTRATITGIRNIQKVCRTNSLRGVPMKYEKKTKYSDKYNTIDLQEFPVRITFRRETLIGDDTDKKIDKTVGFRLITRKSFMFENVRVDFSMVKMSSKPGTSLTDVINSPHIYELEGQYIGTAKTNISDGITSFLSNIEHLLTVFHGTRALLTNTEVKKFREEFKASGHSFYDVVTLTRKHVKNETPHNIITGDYTVTIKADGERSGLYVEKTNGYILKIDKSGTIVSTGIQFSGKVEATSPGEYKFNKDIKYSGDFFDGEYILDKNGRHRFCIFDVYSFRGKDVTKLPLMAKDGEPSRLECANMFLEDLKTSFMYEWTSETGVVSIETKLFVGGTGASMQEAIGEVWQNEYGYNVDGLIFTPRSSGVAPADEREGRAWMYAYKWKPPTQNSIDFLVQFRGDITADAFTGESAQAGELYVSRNPREFIVYPIETMTGEYIPKTPLLRDTRTPRLPSLFQPAQPKVVDAYKILIPLNENNTPVDSEGHKIEHNTIIECAYDVGAARWTVMRTRYDKTYDYRVKREQQYGNDVKTAESIWSSIHNPVSEEMLTKTLLSNNVDDETDTMYYKTGENRNARTFQDVYAFHLKIKSEMYTSNLEKGNTLLELAVGRGGDFNRWKTLGLSKVVGMDLSLNNLDSPVGGAAARYIADKNDPTKKYSLPPTLYVEGDMTQYPLFSQGKKYMSILSGDEAGSTPYLKKFEKTTVFDAVACQFAMHYACKSEEVFRAFAQNVSEALKVDGTFFGTCSDGDAVYSMMLGIPTHTFSKEGKWAGTYSKKYNDLPQGQSIDFGMAVEVLLESFESSETEYLVPFKRVESILKEYSVQIVSTEMFDPSKTSLSESEKRFSSLSRKFVFVRGDGPAEPTYDPTADNNEAYDYPRIAEEEESNTPKYGPGPGPADSEMPAMELAEPAEEKPKTRKLKKPAENPEAEPVLFSTADESKGDYRGFSAMSMDAIEIDGVKYTTLEHYYQAQKAKEFKDEESYTKILKTKTAKAVKAVGRKVENFVEDVWDSKKDAIMEKGLRAKFVQHPKLRTLLLETEDKQIGYADARDSYWSIGTSMSTVKAKIPSKWSGRNKLGKMLMKLRADFKKEAEDAATAAGVGKT